MNILRRCYILMRHHILMKYHILIYYINNASNLILFIFPARHYQSLTNIKKRKIIIFNKINSYDKISKKLRISRYIISNSLKWFKIWYSFYNLSHFDRSRKIFKKFNRWLVRIALIETRLLLKELKSIINIPISE